MSRITELTTRLIDDYKPDLATGELGVVVEDGVPVAFWLRCPCGCGGAIMVPSAGRGRSDGPQWELTAEEDGTYTSNPSILMLSGCHSHYFITKNKVVWC